MRSFNGQPSSYDTGVNDPAGWNSASYFPDPIDAIEGPIESETNQYREHALDCLEIINCVDLFMSAAGDPRLAWVGISLGLGLDSTRGMTAAEIARQMGCTERQLNSSASRFLKLTGLPPANGKFAPWV